MIDKLLTEDKIAINIECDNWREVVSECGKLLVQAEDVDEPFVDSMIDVVEEFGPYMILAPEVAFFHGRPSESVHRVCISLVTLAKPVVFEEYKKETIRCAFAFGAMDSESHINVLKGVAGLLQDNDFLNLIRGNGEINKILDAINRVCSISN